MRNRFALALIVLAAVVSATTANAQTAATDEIRDPEVLLPSQPPVGRPCVIDAATLQDTRVNRDVLRTMQTSPYYSHSGQQRIARYVEVWTDRSSTASWDHRYRTVGCGFYVEDKTYEYRSSDRRYVSSTIETGLHGPGGELFNESKETTRSAYGRVKTEVKLDWSQMTRLEATGDSSSERLGNRYGNSYETTTKFGHGYSSSYNCEVTEERRAVDYHPRLTGKAVLTTCRSESLYARDHSRNVSTSTYVSFPDVPGAGFDPTKCRLDWRSASEFNPRWSGNAFVTRCSSGTSAYVYFPDQKFSFNTDKCRLEMRAAAEFNRNLRGEAYATRCTGESSGVYFPEVEQWFYVDSIDGTFRSDPKQRKMLTEIEVMPVTQVSAPQPVNQPSARQPAPAVAVTPAAAPPPPGQSMAPPSPPPPANPVVASVRPDNVGATRSLAPQPQPQIQPEAPAVAAAPPPVEQWRVVVITSQASYFNLGGHVNGAGVVDSIASGRMREEFTKHANFAKLPAEIRTHILTQNINLTKIAPYRGLLGMNDRELEQKQAVRFEKVVPKGTAQAGN